MSQFADDVLQENLASVRQRVEQAAVKSGRQACDVRLIGVTKYIDAQATRQLVQAGCHCLGESRPQVLWEKGEKLHQLLALPLAPPHWAARLSTTHRQA